MHETSSDSKSERAVPGAAVVASQTAIRPCRVCGKAMRGRKTSACSDGCRAAKSRRKRSDDLVLVEESLTPIRALRGTPAGAQRAREGGLWFRSVCSS
jgi:predicted nucleic acid-binding Zn ribbon protein